MALILRFPKYVNSFFGLARLSSLTFRRKRVLLLDHTSFLGFREIWPRTTATVPSPSPVLAFPFRMDKAFSHLYNNIKAGMVDLYTVEITLDSVKKIGLITPSQLIVLLKCCGSAAYRFSEEGRISLAQKVWDTAKLLGTVFDISHYNTLINVFLENNFKFSPDKILSEIKDAGLEPNVVTYRRLLKAFCQQGDILGASRILEEMKQKKFAINEYDFCSLIQGHCEVGQLEEAVKIFNVMEERGITPTQDPYIYLLCGYAKHGKIEMMEKLLNELKFKDLRMTDAYLFNIIYTLIENNQEEHVDSVLKRINLSSNCGKTPLVVVHRLLHMKKDEVALKLFATFTEMSFGKVYIKEQAHAMVDHFVFHRTPKELVNFCQKVQDEGWSQIAFSYGLKKAILRKDIHYCRRILWRLRQKGFPIRSHYFWPLIVRYSEQGNKGILFVLKQMRDMYVNVCTSTMKLFVKDYYSFTSDWKADIDNLTKHSVSENYVCLILVQKALEKGDLDRAELIASSYGLLRPEGVTVELLVNCLANSSSHEKFLNILYYLAHDVAIYGEEKMNDTEEDNKLAELSSFFDYAFSTLMAVCPREVFLKMLQNASKKKLMITPASAKLICENFPQADVDVLLKEFESGEFELDQDLLKKKSENAKVLRKTTLPQRIMNLAFKNDLNAERLWEDSGYELPLEVHMAMLLMFSRMKSHDKAFKVLERIKNLPGTFLKESYSFSRVFRMSFHSLSECGDIEKLIDAYKVGVQFGFINESYVLPIIRAVLKHCDIKEALQQYPEIFENIRTVSPFLEVMNHLIPTKNTEAITKFTDALTNAVNKNTALTALFTAYLSNGYSEEARCILENNVFKFQNLVFSQWFNTFYEKKSFEETLEVLKVLNLEDRIYFYRNLIAVCYKKKDLEKLKLLWLQCQEDNVSDPSFLEYLRSCIGRLEGRSKESKSNELQHGQPSNWQMSRHWSKVEDQLKQGKYTKETLEQLLNGQVPERIARRLLLLLATEGKSFELSWVVNKYGFKQLIPQVASIMLQNNKANELIDFANLRASAHYHSEVQSCFASQKDRILKLMMTNEDFFQKFKKLALESYQKQKYQGLLVLLMKLCVQTPGKLQEAEQLLDLEDERLVTHFRNHAVSDMLLNSKEEVNFYKNVLESEKVKGVFYEALDHFYERIIKYYNENGDLENALLYLEKATLDAVEEDLDKELISSLKKNLEDRGTTFPYPQLLQEAA